MYYKGHGNEVKVHIMLLFVAKNCWTKSFTLGYWLLYFSGVFDSNEERTPFKVKDCVKWVCMLPFYPCPCLGIVNFVTVGTFIMSNKIVAGSIMVRHMKLLLELSLQLRVYCPMRSTHNALQGVIMTSLVHDVLLAVSLVFGKICRIWCMTGWYCAYLSSISQISLSLRDLSG